MKPTPNLPSRKPDAWLKRSACQGAVATLLVATAWPTLADTQHRVVAGDTLWSIAEQHTGEATQWRVLQNANRLANPHQLRIGQVLKVPAGAAALPVANASVVFVQGEVLATGPDGQQVGTLRTGTTVPEGTLIEVRDKAFVRLKLADGSAFGLSSGSTARLERLRRDDGTQQSHTVIRMLSGRVESEVVPRQHPQTRFDVHTPMAVASVRGTRFGVSVSPNEATSEVASGKVAVRSLLNRRQTTTLAAGDGARVGTTGGLQRGALLPAADLSALPTAWDDGEFVSFALPTQPQARAYRARVLRSNTPGAVLREAWVTDPAVLWQALDDGQYTLTVQGLDKLGLLGQTAEHHFQVQATPAAPLFRQPAAGTTVSGSGLTLRCTELLDVAGYRIQVASDTSFKQPLVDVTRPDRCEHVAQLPPGSYHWRVASLAAGTPARQGPFSLPSAFVVGADAPTAGTDADTTFWSPRRGLSYRVQLAADAGFTRVLSDDWVSGSQVALPAGAQDVYLRWQSRDAQGRTSRLSAVHRVTPNNTGLRTEDNQPVKGGDNTIGTGNSPLQQPR